MIEETRPPEAMYIVWQSDGSQIMVDHECAPLVDRALKLWAECRRDTWLSLHGPTGAEYVVLASSINSTTMSTAAQRTQSIAMDKAIEDERAENRRLAGFIESE